MNNNNDWKSRDGLVGEMLCYCYNYVLFIVGLREYLSELMGNVARIDSEPMIVFS